MPESTSPGGPRPHGPEITGAAPEVPPVRIPVTGELDLHTFRPVDVPSLVEEYLRECQQRGLREVRIVHGKGTGTLRTTVRAVLGRSPRVATFRDGDERTGGWGATLVGLRRRTD